MTDPREAWEFLRLHVKNLRAFRERLFLYGEDGPLFVAIAEDAVADEALASLNPRGRVDGARTARVWLVWHPDPGKNRGGYPSSTEPDAERRSALEAQGFRIGFVDVVLDTLPEAVDLGTVGLAET